MENPTSIANFFVKKAISDGSELTPMKLLKLVYLSHGWYLGLNNEPLIPEAVQAWKFGPVIKSVYEDFRNYRDSQITELAFDIGKMAYTTPSDDTIKAFLNKIWDVYKGFNGLQLSTITHQVNSPWDIVWNQLGGKDRVGAIIPNDLIAQYYSNKAGNT